MSFAAAMRLANGRTPNPVQAPIFEPQNYFQEPFHSDSPYTETRADTPRN